MSVKSSISLSESQDAFARSLLESGRYSSMSAVLQQGLELLRERSEAEALEKEALRELLRCRSEGPYVTADTMQDRVMRMVDRKKKNALGLES